MDIVACVDRGFVMPTGVMAYSVCYNNQDADIVFHLIADESVSQDDRDNLRNTICSFKGKRVVFYNINSKKVDHFPNYMEYGPSLAAYYRLFLTELLPNTIDKVLYLDGDTIVRKSLLPLWSTDISHVALAATPELAIDEMDTYTRLQYKSSFGYFNSGVLLINLRYWREHNVSPIFIEYIKNHQESIFLFDQDVLNYVFREKKYSLPYEYNFMQKYLLTSCYSKYEKLLSDTMKDPAIIHFSGSSKPWNAYMRQPHPFSSSFYKYQDQTVWKGCRLETRPLKLKIKNFLADNLRRLKIMSPLDTYIDIKPID